MAEIADERAAAPLRRTVRRNPLFRTAHTAGTTFGVADKFAGRDRGRVYRDDVPHGLPVSTLAH